jgi:predicted alpha/beta-hydrolase family hydrolase
VIRPLDLGICHGYEYDGDPARTAVLLPGRMLAGMPANAFAQQGLTAAGWRVVQVWDEYLDPDQDADAWVHDRLAAAVQHVPEARQLLVVGKSMGTRAAADAAEHAWPAIWLTPLLEDAGSVSLLRRRAAPALLIGGTADPMWNGRIAREITDDVLELEGADHGLAKAEHLQQIADAVAAFAARV